MNFGLLWLFGLGVGVLSGLLGIGGGIVLVPGLMFLFHFTQQEAQGTSLAVLIPPIGIFAAIVYYQHGFVRLPVVAWIALGFLMGAFLGAKLVPSMPIPALRFGFGLLMLYLGLNFLFSPRTPKPFAALPAGVVTVLLGSIAPFMRRQRQPRPPLSPPDEDIEYHI